MSVEKKKYECSALPKGWQREEIIRKTGLSAGKVDVYYYSPNGKKFRSKPQLARYLGDSIDLATFDFRTGKVNSLLVRKNKKQRGTQFDYSRGVRNDASLVPPIRQTASIFKQPVTVHKMQEGKVKSDVKHGQQDKPKQMRLKRNISNMKHHWNCSGCSAEDHQPKRRRGRPPKILAPTTLHSGKTGELQDIAEEELPHFQDFEVSNPDTFIDVTSQCQETPKVVQEKPQAVQEKPKVVEERPKVVEERPKTREERTKQFHEMPKIPQENLVISLEKLSIPLDKSNVFKVAEMPKNEEEKSNVRLKRRRRFSKRRPWSAARRSAAAARRNAMASLKKKIDNTPLPFVPRRRMLLKRLLLQDETSGVCQDTPIILDEESNSHMSDLHTDQSVDYGLWENSEMEAPYIHHSMVNTPIPDIHTNVHMPLSNPVLPDNLMRENMSSPEGLLTPPKHNFDVEGRNGASYLENREFNQIFKSSNSSDIPIQENNLAHTVRQALEHATPYITSPEPSVSSINDRQDEALLQDVPQVGQFLSHVLQSQSLLERNVCSGNESMVQTDQSYVSNYYEQSYSSHNVNPSTLVSALKQIPVLEQGQAAANNIQLYNQKISLNQQELQPGGRYWQQQNSQPFPQQNGYYQQTQCNRFYSQQQNLQPFSTVSNGTCFAYNITSSCNQQNMACQGHSELINLIRLQNYAIDRQTEAIKEHTRVLFQTCQLQLEALKKQTEIFQETSGSVMKGSQYKLVSINRKTETILTQGVQ